MIRRWPAVFCFESACRVTKAFPRQAKRDVMAATSLAPKVFSACRDEDSHFLNRSDSSEKSTRG